MRRTAETVPFRRLLVAIGAVLCSGAIGAAPVVAQSGPSAGTCLVPDSIVTKLERIARRVAGNVGIAAIHLETGARVSLNGDQRYPMASVSKIPMALEFLRRVDEGEISLDERMELPITDFRPGQSPLASWSGGRPVHVTVDSLFGLMLEVSDNSATDAILRLAGGPVEVTRHLRSLGIEDVDVDRSEARTFADYSGIPASVPERQLFRYNYFRMRDALPQSHRDSARAAFGDDPRDTATPDAMADLLAKIWYGKGLSEDSRALLLESMSSTKSGRRRIRGMLPSAIPVAHKTGTLAGAVNDVGIMQLPDGGGTIVIAVFVNTLNRTTWRRERTIAEMSRELYDYFRRAPEARSPGVLAYQCNPDGLQGGMPLGD